eukprot:CAMPEP_0202451414 /NCGR_PEP_ID=MMETSP1360-20130828/9856_1 /ASSEMBLY_ACC=CAM_ASM_000848 /TAXON_ID=515479 /ORGANISM="Licmophora paradoxa, Strain CCMP2313" /LENGTH=138 /DNA_ID=CAMNT_0049069985 /DNA_START=602 /DNA_END=1018 /DNA_ORIENTATION=+
MKRNGIYSGEISDRGIPHGQGLLRFYNGDIYDGPFCHGEMHGDGAIFQFSDHNMEYRGDYRHNLKHGSGELIGIYKGSFQFDKPHGFGIQFKQDKSVAYIGQWKNGKPCSPASNSPVYSDEESDGFTFQDIQFYDAHS